ncbi:MAG: hypothetical protein H9W81_07605 [Enterococcus sp.]|nr:hypothetical protein [Enterococcus sp.]
MAKKNQTIPFTLEGAAAYLSVQFMKTKDAKKHYPNATVRDIMTKHFDVINAIRLNPSIVPTAPHIVEGELVGELYLISANKKTLRTQVETIWDYEWEGTVALTPIQFG